MPPLAYFIDMPDGSAIAVPPHRVGLFLPTWPAVGSGNALCGWIPGRGRVAITRKVKLKSNPSRHPCDARCMNARGMNCECECGGRNHGRGAPKCEAI